MAFPMPLPHFTGLLNLLPLSLVVWTGHMIVFHAVGLGFAWCDRTLGYQPRSRNEGKKISWRDGFGAIAMLVNQRLSR